jgi:hypothetical protein
MRRHVEWWLIDVLGIGRCWWFIFRNNATFQEKINRSSPFLAVICLVRIGCISGGGRKVNREVSGAVERVYECINGCVREILEPG